MVALPHCTSCLLLTAIILIISSMFQLMSSYIIINRQRIILNRSNFKGVVVVAPSTHIHRLYLTTNIIVVGKKGSVEDWIQSGYNEYEKRLKPTMNIQTVFIKSDDELLSYVATNKNKLGSIIFISTYSLIKSYVMDVDTITI